MLSLDQMVARSERRMLDLLTAGRRDAPARQQTMAKNIEWSYQLLGAEEKRLFARLSVFVGGFTRHAAEKVCGSPSGANGPIERALVSLLMNQLIVPERPMKSGLQARFNMLEVIREYAGDRLTESGERNTLQQRHSEFFCEFTEALGIGLGGPGPRALFDAVGADVGNVIAALSCCASNAADRGLRLASALRTFWLRCGFISAGARRLERLIAQEGSIPAALRAKALRVLGLLLNLQGNRDRFVSASRTFRMGTGFTVVVLLSLALGVGANTAVFSILDTVMLKLLPVKDPEGLVFLVDSPKTAQAEASLTRTATPYFAYDEYDVIGDRVSALSGISAFRGAGRVSIGYHDRSDVADAQLVSANYFSLLGVGAALGRTFEPSEDKPGPDNPAAVISYQYWQREFGGDHAVVGQLIRVNNSPVIIVGVAPAGFFGLEPGAAPEIWLPIAVKEQFTSPRDRRTQIIGRLPDKAGARRAQAELEVIFDQILNARATVAGGTLCPEDRQEILERKIEIAPGGRGLRDLRDRLGDPLLVMMMLVGLVLLIASANVASLLIVKAGQRRKEFAIRAALGASRRRLMKQLVTEGVLLGAGGGLLGILLARWALDALVQALNTGPNPVKLSISPDARMAIYTLAIMIAAVVLFGVLPALRATRIDVVSALKENSPGAISGRNRIAPGSVLGVVQVAVSVVLLIAAGLLTLTFRNLRSIDPGVNPDRVLLATADPSLIGYKGRRAVDFYRSVEDRFEHLDGVRSFSLSSFSPLGQIRGIAMVAVSGFVPTGNDDLVVNVNRVGPAYFETVGIPILGGRGIGKSDQQGAPRIAVVNERFAAKYFQSDDPVGKTIGVHFVGGSQEVEIVGLAKDSKYGKLQEETFPTIYTACMQGDDAGRMTLEIRAEADPVRLIPAVRRTVADSDPSVPLFDIRTLRSQIDESLVQERLIASLSGFFGLAALSLACIGLFGIISQEVGSRTNEIGVRMALGASPGRVRWTVMRRALGLVLAGIATGLAGATLAAPMASRLLFGLRAREPVVLALAALGMAGAAAVAAYVSARHASRVDPIKAIRCE
jgi:predicted permease